ncbi:protein WHI4, partial [Tanacetum coccineum]
VVAFATFVNHPSAIAALHTLNGVKFDPQTGSILHIELARSNSRRKNKPGPEAYIVIDKRSKARKYDQGSSDEGITPVFHFQLKYVYLCVGSTYLSTNKWLRNRILVDRRWNKRLEGHEYASRSTLTMSDVEACIESKLSFVCKVQNEKTPLRLAILMKSSHFMVIDNEVHKRNVID